jgi:hypothetical protein
MLKDRLQRLHVERAPALDFELPVFENVRNLSAADFRNRSDREIRSFRLEERRPLSADQIPA